ncbi:MAG: hypothetical protein H6732_02505 [Alphaproteobacteria bacterium]|nr:hypothetical protein [Alphaproteobacteria bacterium]
MSEAARADAAPRRRPLPAALEPAAAGLLVLAAQAMAWLDPVLGTLDDEEAFTVAQAVLGRWLGVGEASLLQYTPFCNGCTVDAALGTFLFGLLGERMVVWKLVPAAWGVFAGVVVFAVVRARHGHRAAWWALAALLLVPPLVVEGGARAFGNHLEGGWLAVATLALASTARGPWRGLVVGLLGVACLWVLLSTVWVLPAVALALALAGRGRALAGWLGGLAVGGVCWGLLGHPLRQLEALRAYAATLTPGQGGLAPSSPFARAEAWVAAWAPLTPGVPGWLGVAPWLALAVAVVLLAGRREALPRSLLLAGCGLAVTLWVAPVQLPTLRAFTVHSARYAVPAAQLGAVVVGLAVAGVDRRRGPLAATLLLGLWGLPGLVGRAGLWQHAGTQHLDATELVSWSPVRRTLLGRRGVGDLAWHCDGDLRCRYHQAWREGRALGSSTCAWRASPYAVEPETTGWRHGLAAGIASCAHEATLCARWETTVGRVAVRDDATLLAAVEGLAGADPEARRCARLPTLGAVVEALLPAPPPSTPPDLDGPVALQAWALVRGHVAAPRARLLPGAGVASDDPGVQAAFARGVAAGGWAVPALDLGLAVPATP